MAESNKSIKINRYLLGVAVFVCGAAVMIFELIGSRLIAPYVGASIYVWTSLIGVILASLSLGYYFGGKLADRNPAPIFFSGIIMISAALICLTAAMRDVGALLTGVSPSLEIRSVILSIILFTPASLFLGMVSPYAIRLKINKLETAGKDAGNLYALSTLGSICGTFLAGFCIIPSVGSRESLFLTALVLAITSVALVGGKSFKKPLLIFLMLISGALYFYNIGPRIPVIADIDTQYGRVLVYEVAGTPIDKTIRILSTGGPFGIQNAIFPDRIDDLVIGYTKLFRLAGYFNPTLKTALMMGGGAYTYPRDFINNFPQATMDIVEIDPAVTQIAKKYFYFKPDPRLSIFSQDGREYLNSNKKKYDVIFNDAFGSVSTPFQLTTKEAVQEEYNSLNDDGLVLSNVTSSISGDSGKFFRAEYATYKEIFPQVFVFLPSKVPGSGEIQNIVLVGSKSVKPFDFKTADQRFSGYLGGLWKGPVETDVPVLTDDFAPAEYYQEIMLKDTGSDYLFPLLQ
jgi:predicted membrane-bound spermidine synthase